MATNSSSSTVLPSVEQISEMQPSGRKATAIAIALLILSVLSVFLRVLIRVKRGWSFDLGDLFLGLGLCCFAAYCGVLIRGLQTSGGTLEKDEFTEASAENFYKYLYALQILGTFAITFIKLSILFLYTTIFVTKKFRRAAWIAMAICVAWLIAFLFVLIFECSPVYAYWDFSVIESGQGSCIAYNHIIIAYEVTNILIDVLILSLPMFVLGSLQLSKVRKYECAGVFLLGGFDIIISIIRVCYLSDATDSDAGNKLSDGMNWSTAELAVAIVCASVPTYGHYITKMRSAVSSVVSWIGSSSWRTDPTTPEKTVSDDTDSDSLHRQDF